MASKKYSFTLEGIYDAETNNLEDIVHIINVFHGSIDDAVTSLNGLDSWFLAYISNEAFTSLGTTQKREAFQAFLGVREVLDTIQRNQKDA